MITVDLGTWKDETDYTLDELATAFGVSRARVVRIINGEYMPRDELLDRIERVTEGRVDRFALHQRHVDWLRDQGKGRPDLVTEVSISEAKRFLQGRRAARLSKAPAA